MTLALILVAVFPAAAQRDKFPLTAKITGWTSEERPAGASTSMSTRTSMPGTIWAAPASNSHTTFRTVTVVTYTAEIGSTVYRLEPIFRPFHRLAPSPAVGSYPARIDNDGHTVWLSLPDKKGRQRAAEFSIISVSEGPKKTK